MGEYLSKNVSNKDCAFKLVRMEFSATVKKQSVKVIMYRRTYIFEVVTGFKEGMKMEK